MNDRDDESRAAGPGGGPTSRAAITPSGEGGPPSRHEPPPPGAHLMNILRWGLFIGLLALAAVSIGSYVMSRQPSAANQEKKKALYHCPMHPSYTSDKPGECPICGMSLELIPADEHAQQVAAGGDGDVPGLSSVHITPDRVQLIGVRTVRVEQRRLGGQLELVGFVAPDEAWLSRIQVRVSGWVEFLHVNRTGDRVEEGEPLLTLYSPELYQSEQEFLIELGGHRDSLMAHEAGGLAAGRERLRLLGVPADEVARLERERVASSRIVIRSPATGTVLERGVTQGQYIAADTPLFTVADLSRVWVLADLYEMDFSRVRVGDPARFTADALAGRAFEGRVDFVYPTVSSETRTLKVRLSLANPRRDLRPGMYGRVVVSSRAGASTLALPGEAVIKTGENSYVFLARTGGHFEPRVVRTGLQDGDWVQILDGVAAGDTVVASASFLIDSESRLKAAIAGMGAQPSSGHKH